MADAQSVVELVFKGVDQTGEATQAALKNVQDFSTNIQKLTSPIADATEKAFKLEGALLLATGALFGYSVKVAGEFDAAFREIASLTGTASDNLGDFRQEILDYAATSTQPLDSITNAIYTAISAGVDYVDSVEFIRDAELLAVAGKADLTEAVGILVSSLNAFGKEAKDAGDFADILFKAVQDGQTTLPELANSLGRVAGLAAPAGIEMSELAAAISALTLAGLDTPGAVTALTGLISNLISPSEQAAKAAEELGIEFGAQALKAEGLSGLLPILAKAIDGNVGVASDLFGNIRALNGIMVLTSEDGIVRFQDALEGQANRTGVVADAYDDMAKSIEFSNQKVATALKLLFIEIGDPLLEAYGGVAEAIASVFVAIAQNITGTGLEEVLDYVKDLLQDTEGFFRQIADNLPAALNEADFSGFIRNIDAIRDGINKAFGGIDLSTPEGLAKLMTSVSDAFGLLGEFTGGAIGNFEIIVTTAFKAFEAFSKLNPDLVGSVGAFAGMVTIFDKLLPALDTLLLLLVVKQTGGLVAGANGAAKAVGAFKLSLGGLVSVLAAGGIGYAIGTYLVEPIDKAIDKLTGSGSLGGAIYDFVEYYNSLTSPGAIGMTSDFISDWVLSWGKATDDLSAAIERNEQKIRDMDEAWGDADTSIDKAALALNNFETGWDEYGGYIDTVNQALRDFAESQGFVIDEAGRWRELKQPLSEIAPSFDDINDATGNWIRTVVDGVETFSQRVGGAIDDVVSTTKSYESASGGTLSVIGGQFDDAGKAAEDAFQKTDAYFLKLMDLASEERLALIEAKVSLDIAEVEANAEMVVAAFDSITSSIGDSYAVLGDLYALFADTDGSTQRQLERFITEENERLDAQLDVQKRLIEAQIENINAKTDALYRGEALIQIDGAGLQPHLEGFMWEILRTIQVRVNEDGLEMLLGTPA